ncbi:50S ribosomal protein L13 [Blastocystis sp. ATCC 50177/Nand II]|uniref:50S ribosomal protein L13 n=1 Tax=Blastocystis sp. subtype 1 (strain ATCC 50177 / NandII) TaxID=478820 RepID=A0A196SJ30_BLAHN|nr:50S ribosomal protein L13 [Blastocystis sp. ATCC 50177/Nand II]
MSGTGRLLERNGGRVWHVVDAKGQVLGRLATQVSAVLMGKHKPTYNPSDPECGDYVVVVNAGDIVYSKKTYEKKVYRWYTGWPGGLKERTLKEMEKRDPEKILWKAVYGMLPKNKLREERIKRLRIYMDGEHKHAPQVRDVDWKIWDLQIAKEPRSDDALLSAPVREIPEDWGRVLLDWNNYEKDYKDPYPIDFNKLHDLYLQAHPEEKKKEDALFTELEKLKLETDKAMEADPVRKAKAVLEMEKSEKNAIDVEKLVRKE